MRWTDFEDRTVQTRFGGVHYRVHAGKVGRLVLLHGLAASTRSWTRLIEHLPDDMYVCAVDLLGHGESDAPHIEYTIAEQKACLSEIIKREGISDYFLLGHSYGGWIAASCALTEQGIRGIIIEDGAGLEAFYESVRDSVHRQAYKHEVVRKSAELGAHKHVTLSILKDEFSEHQLGEGELRKIRCPALILWGEQDNAIDIVFARIFHEGIGGSELFVVKGAKHTPHYTHAEEVAKRVVEFMGRA